jgi:hypothetical protein
MVQPNVPVHCAITSSILEARVQISTDRPDTKTQIIDVVLSVRANVEVVTCIRWVGSFHIIPN